MVGWFTTKIWQFFNGNIGSIVFQKLSIVISIFNMIIGRLKSSKHMSDSDLYSLFFRKKSIKYSNVLFRHKNGCNRKVHANNWQNTPSTAIISNSSKVSNTCASYICITGVHNWESAAFSFPVTFILSHPGYSKTHFQILRLQCNAYEQKWM